jgi:hypothetical protein
MIIGFEIGSVKHIEPIVRTHPNESLSVLVYVVDVAVRQSVARAIEFVGVCPRQFAGIQQHEKEDSEGETTSGFFENEYVDSWFFHGEFGLLTFHKINIFRVEKCPFSWLQQIYKSLRHICNNMRNDNNSLTYIYKCNTNGLLNFEKEI